MLQLLRSCALVATALMATDAAAQAQIRKWTGASMPPLARPDLAGRVHDLKALRGRVVLVNFWATWCEPCRDELPSLERLKAKLEGRPFDVVAVNYGEGAPRIGEFVRRHNLSLPVLLDPEKEAAAAWKAGGLPMTFLVDARGRVRYSAFGERDWSVGEALGLVEKLLAEAPGARR
jgi:thiol-disulfide isomerase/thioredoxin